MVSNMNGSYFTIITRYPLRWSIETIFWELKNYYDFSSYHFHGDEGNKFSNFLHLNFLRFNLWEIAPKYLRKHYKKMLPTVVSKAFGPETEFGKFLEVFL